MDFRGWIPPEIVVGLTVIVVLASVVGLFIARDFVIPFLDHHVTIH